MIAFLTSRAFAYVAGLLAVLAMAFAINQWMTRAGAEHRLKQTSGELTKTQGDLSRCEVARLEAEATVSRQNDAVRALEADSAARVAAAREAAARARRAADAQRRQVAEILSASTDEPDRCQAAVLLIRGYIR